MIKLQIVWHPGLTEGREAVRAVFLFHVVFFNGAKISISSTKDTFVRTDSDLQSVFLLLSHPGSVLCMTPTNSIGRCLKSALHLALIPLFYIKCSWQVKLCYNNRVKLSYNTCRHGLFIEFPWILHWEICSASLKATQVFLVIKFSSVHFLKKSILRPT